MKINSNRLRHLYISPLEQCNLNCQICYTRKTKERLTKEEILRFVKNYSKKIKLQTITFCGGEVFILPWFIDLVNELTPKYYVQIITNGTIDNLEKIEKPEAINLIVSIDGIPEYHESNRGKGIWKKCIEFIKHGMSLGMKAEVFSIITKENFGKIAEFKKELGIDIPITFHPRKPMNYLKNHPVSNRVGKVEGFGFISELERQKLEKKENVFPPTKFGCYQIALMSDGMVYGCCEGIKPLGGMDKSVNRLIGELVNRLEKARIACQEPEFRCGMEE